MKIRDGVILRTVAGTNVITPAEANDAFDGILSVNSTGTFIFNLLQNEATREDIINGIVGAYDVDYSVAAEDVDAFIEKLASCNLIEKGEN